MWFKPTYDIELAAGIMRDDDGRLLMPESGERKMANFHYNRESVLEPAVQKMFDIVVAENRKWWRALGHEEDPFIYRSKKARRRKPRNKTLSEMAKAEMKARQDWLDGEIQEVEVLFEFVPSASQSDARLAQVGAWAEKGLLTTETFHEVAGIDPDLERTRMMRQATEDRVPIEMETRSLWSDEPFSQLAKSDGATKVTENQTSPGRPKDSARTQRESADEEDDQE